MKELKLIIQSIFGLKKYYNNLQLFINVDKDLNHK